MGFLDDVLGTVFDPFSGPGRAGRRAIRIHEQGDVSPGVLVGIHVRDQSESAMTWRWAVEVTPASAEPFRATCKQAVGPARDEIRLGMHLDVRHDGARVVLPWDPTGPGGWGRGGKVADGIDDNRLPGMTRGEPAEARVEGWRPKFLLGMPTQDREVLLSLDGASPEWRSVRVPEYAGHLLATGTTWPVRVRERQIIGGTAVDVGWLEALERHGYGAGTPTPPATHAAEG